MTVYFCHIDPPKAGRYLRESEAQKISLFVRNDNTAGQKISLFVRIDRHFFCHSESRAQRVVRNLLPL